MNCKEHSKNELALQAVKTIFESKPGLSPRRHQLSYAPWLSSALFEAAGLGYFADKV